MATFDVTLPITKPVVFPSRCVVCEKANPDGTIKLSILGASSSSTMDMAIGKTAYTTELKSGKVVSQKSAKNPSACSPDARCRRRKLQPIAA